MIWILIVTIGVTVLICGLLMFFDKPARERYYERGYKETIKSYREHGITGVTPPCMTVHSCDENYWYHRGCYDAYLQMTKNIL